MSSRNSRPLKMLYCVIGIALLIYCGYIVEILVMHIWHKAPHGEHAEGLSQEDKLFHEMLAGVGQESSHGVAFRDMKEIHKLYDFHKTERKALLDEHNLCVSCHGDVPHDKKKEIRAFLNMHTFFMACETCHIRTGDKMSTGTKFVWYDKTTGEESEQIGLNLYLGDTPYKLMPKKADGESFYATDQMKKYVAEFKKNVGSMIPSAKSASMKVIHRPMTELKDTVRCDDCHTSNREEVYLPYAEIGYPDRRTSQLIGNEVVGMINKYEKFYLPDFLIPKEGSGSEN